MMPVLVGGCRSGSRCSPPSASIATTIAFAVIDQTGVLYAPLAAAAEAHNAEGGDGAGATGPHFLPRQVDPAGRSVDRRSLSTCRSTCASKDALRVRRDSRQRARHRRADADADRLLHRDAVVRRRCPTGSRRRSTRRFRSAGSARPAIDPALVAQARHAAAVTTLGLVERSADGTVEPGAEGRRSSARSSCRSA